MEQALYRKYRSRTFDEVVGQDHITQTLKKALKNHKVAHAYLFTGPRGVGKTSVARILAHEVNKIPYTDDSMHLDILEIDAASNRRIDEIRHLRERVHVAPAAAKYKVYIIDEVHMLTREAFNALLKTLEEPPAHCIFILATTEAHKLPATIVSRTQRFNFKPIEVPIAVKHLAQIAKAEHLKIDEISLQLLAEHAEGSFRDSISLLNQLTAGGQPIAVQDVQDMLGLPPMNSIVKLLDSLRAADPVKTLELLERLWEQGANPIIVSTELSKLVRQEIVVKGLTDWAIELLRQLLLIPASGRPRDQLEIALLEATNQTPQRGDSSAKSSARSQGVVVTPPVKVTASPGQKVAVTKRSSAQAAKSVFNLEQWETIVTEAKEQRASLYTALRLARPSLDGHTLTLAFQFPLHQRKINQPAHRKLIEELLDSRSDGQIKVVSVVDKTVHKPVNATKPVVDRPDALQTISSIFGQAEVLES